MNATATENLSTVEVCKQIKASLKARSGKMWSVTRGRGTACGWISINVSAHGTMTAEQQAELATLLGLSSVHCQGVSIPSSHGHYREYIDRAAGRNPSVIGETYWD